MTGRRVDANHSAIKAALKAAGCKVFDSHAFGDGFPDLVVVNPNGTAVLLVEVKGELKFTVPEVKFMLMFVNSAYRIATSPEQAVEIVRGGTNANRNDFER